MEINVWLSFVRAAISLLSQFASSTGVQKQESPTSSPDVPESAVSSTSTSKTTPEKPCLLRIQRNPAMETADAHFGAMDFNGKVLGVTMERTAVAIPEGTYRGYKRDSAHFQMRVVGIEVPNRTNIECHPANFPSQLLGCIAVGESKDGDALDNSRTAFDAMMLAVPEEFTVIVE